MTTYTDIILQILQWAVPGGIGGCVTWLVSRQIRRTRVVKEVHDTYKEMYHDISSEIIELRKENQQILSKSERIAEESRGLKRSLDRLSRAIESCPYRTDCPIRSELQDTAGNGNNTRQRQPKQHRQRGDGRQDNRTTAAARHRDTAPHADDDAKPARGGGIHQQQRKRNGDGTAHATGDDTDSDGTEDADNDR